MIVLTVIATIVAAYWFMILFTRIIGLRRVPKLPRISRPLDEEPLVSAGCPTTSRTIWCSCRCSP